MPLLALAIAVPTHFAGQAAPPLPKLESLHCIMVAGSEAGGGAGTEIWAKDSNVRSERTADGQKVVTIQLGNMLYTYRTGSPGGEKKRLGSGLASMGLIRQIEWIKEKGQKIGSETIEGEMYDRYQYEERTGTGGEIVSVLLSERTSVPRAWSSMTFGGNKASTWTVYYKDALANVSVPDEMFTLPPEIKFSK
jgi:hypothetical protein